MTSRRPIVAAFLAAFAATGAGLSAQTEALEIANACGAVARFEPAREGWSWVALRSPAGPADGWVIREAGLRIAAGDQEGELAPGWTLVDQQPDRLALEQEDPVTGLRLRRVYGFGAAANVLRIESWVQGTSERRLLTCLGLLDVQVDGEHFRETGPAPASFPAFGQSLFGGIEHVSGECSVVGEARDRLLLQHRPRCATGPDWQLVATAVVGWTEPDLGTGLTGPDGLREAFLHYLNTIRVRPERPVLHTDTWWTVPLPLNEKNVLADIDGLQKALAERTGMFFDTYCVDLGWSNPRTLWSLNTDQFPGELRNIKDRLSAAGARLGLWVSPGSGYPDGLNNTWLQSQGYEMMPFGGPLGQVPCFALGTRYQREFRERLAGYARQYELGHVILDFMPLRCDVPTHGHPVGPESRYAIDAGLADVLDALRAVNPTIALEPMVCGYPPSPWWLMKTPFVLGPAGDDMPYGRVPSPDWLESLVTARDAVYRPSQESWIMPTQALETFDLIVLTPGAFANTAVMAIGRGRWFLSTYLKASALKPEDWDFLAGLVRWARANKAYLENAWQIGGRPESREAYGYMFRHPEKTLYCVRNPWIEARAVTLPPPAGVTSTVETRMLYPRRATVGRMGPGDPALSLVLGPYETAFLETRPAVDEPPSLVPDAPPEVSVAAAPPRRAVTPAADPEREQPILNYSWRGTLRSPEISEGELCVLIEGDRNVHEAQCRITLGRQGMTPRVATSVGQFAAATEPSPDNWAWHIIPLSKGELDFSIEVSAAQAQIAVGVYARGVVPSPHDEAEPAGTVSFPTVRPTLRAWSQTLQPLLSIPPSPDESAP